MKIKTISYKRTKNLGDYENFDRAIATLKDRVNEQLGIADQVKLLEEKREKLVYKVEQLEHEVAVASDKWEKVQTFMSRLGIPIKTVTQDDDIPF